MTHSSDPQQSEADRHDSPALLQLDDDELSDDDPQPSPANAVHPRNASIARRFQVKDRVIVVSSLATRMVDDAPAPPWNDRTKGVWRPPDREVELETSAYSQSNWQSYIRSIGNSLSPWKPRARAVLQLGVCTNVTALAASSNVAGELPTVDFAEDCTRECASA